MLPKHTPIRSKALRQSARGQRCVRCGAEDDTVVLCHYTGIRQHYYGKGRSQKCDDVYAAELCARCHRHFDQPSEYKSVIASEEFLHCVAMTWRRWLNAGLITIRGAK